MLDKHGYAYPIGFASDGDKEVDDETEVVCNWEDTFISLSESVVVAWLRPVCMECGKSYYKANLTDSWYHPNYSSKYKRMKERDSE